MDKSIKNKTLKSMISLSTGVLLATAFTHTGVNVAEASSEEVDPEFDPGFEEDIAEESVLLEEAETFSNEAFFEAFEEEGYDIEDYLTEEEINEALAADNQGQVTDPGAVTPQINPFGGTNVVVERADGGYDLYIHGSIASIAAGAGVGAAAAALAKVAPVAALLAKYEVSTGALSGALGVLTSLTFSELSQGVIVTVNSNFTPQGITTQ